jgi:hypothetical protein
MFKLTPLFDLTGRTALVTGGTGGAARREASGGRGSFVGRRLSPQLRRPGASWPVRATYSV